MYAALPSNQQSAIFGPAPHGMRKCILATNIAETSITIPGIKYVIDTGKHKEKMYISRDTGTGMRTVPPTDTVLTVVFAGFDTLLTKDITRSSAMQRAGRAGREVSLFVHSHTLLVLIMRWFSGSRLLLSSVHGRLFQRYAIIRRTRDSPGHADCQSTSTEMPRSRP